MTIGTVRVWDAEQGWGVIDSSATPGGCWASWTVLPGSGWRYVTVGQQVHFGWEKADQDGFAYRATRVWGVEVGGATGETASYSDTPFPTTWDTAEDQQSK